MASNNHSDPRLSTPLSVQDVMASTPMYPTVAGVDESLFHDYINHRWADHKLGQDYMVNPVYAEQHQSLMTAPTGPIMPSESGDVTDENNTDDTTGQSLAAFRPRTARTWKVSGCTLIGIGVAGMALALLLKK